MHTFAPCSNTMKKALYVLFIGYILTSCSEFQKALKSDDISEKFKVATQLFENEKWSKAYRIFNQILPNYRGKPQAEKLTYMHAMCSYKMGDYYISSYHFDKFTNAYPKSEKAEEAAFLGAKGYYYNSPIYTKEQKETVTAIEKLQLFINAYPNSNYLSEANVLIKELDYKLEKKAFEIAKQYDLIRDYKASIKSFNNFLLEFPGSSLKEDALYYRFDAEYNLATRSVDYLKKERIETAISYFNSLKRAFPDSKYFELATEQLAELKTLDEEFTKDTSK